MAERVFSVGLADGADSPTVRAALAGPVPDLLILAWRQLAADNVATGDYMARLSRQSALEYPYLNDPYMAAVVNTSPYADYLEYGRAGFHLASRWGHGGGKWLVSKSGHLYRRVPFRIRTPVAAGGGATTARRRQAMPKEVYKQTAGMEHGSRLTGFGVNYKQSKSYEYYRQTFANFPEVLNDVQGYTWKASKYESMFQAGMRHTPGGGTQSQYMTIRTITPESAGWYIPPTPPHNFADRALAQAQADISDILDRAAAQDAEAAVAYAARRLA